jgi:hypothetical protein
LGKQCRSVWGYFLIMEKVGYPPPTPARTGMVLYWVMMYSGGHKQCRWCGLGFRAVPVEWLSRPAHSLSDVVLYANTGPYGESVPLPGVLE